MPELVGTHVNGGRIAAVVCCLGVLNGLPIAQSAEASARPAVYLPLVQLGGTNRVPECVTPDRLMSFLRSHNPAIAPRFARIASDYATYGTRLAVRWDVAFFQMMVETANLSFRRPDGQPGDVRPEHNNFAGIGAIGDGQPGEIFATQVQGVRAHLEHVLHYSGINLPAPVAERTRKVQQWRVLETWHRQFNRPINYTDVARRWAPQAPAYLDSIERKTFEFQRKFCGGGGLFTLDISRRAPSIAATGWRFEKLDGPPGTAGVTPPTGKPDFVSSRISLGVGRPPITAGAPPLPVSNRDTAARLSTVTVARLPTKAAPTKPAAQRVAVLTKPHAQSVLPDKLEPDRPRISADDRLRQMISDRKVLLRTHVGVVVPIVFDADGEMRGEAASLSFFLGASRDTGRWWVAKGKLCQKWRIWLDRETHCILLRDRGGTIHWQADDGKTGTARIVSK